MSWRDDMAAALADFRSASKLAGQLVSNDEVHVEFCEVPHKPPSRLPIGMMAVYGFWWNGEWLKIGQAGPKSQARYTSQHYNAGSAPSTLAASLIRDGRMAKVSGFDPAQPGEWIKGSCCRVNILLPAEKGDAIRKLLEAFLHVRLKPLYEG